MDMHGADSWRSLRGMRARNPISIKRGSERSEVFGASLEQAEQFFKAARVMGYETRPVVLFYGLSQLGRAIAAAADSSLLATKDSWRLSGHGIRIPALSDVARKGRLSELRVQDQGRGSFTQLAEIFDCSSVPSPTPLGLFWNALPEAKDYLIGDSELRPVLEVVDGVDEVSPPGDWGRASVVVFSGCPEGVEDLIGFLKTYPAMRRITSLVDRYKLGVVRRGHLTGEVYMEPPEGIAYRKFSKLHGTLYRGRRYFFPGIHETGDTLHPILYWWSVLYSLSMLARYEPSGWAKMVDVDGNVDAVAIERVLDAAIEAIPEISLAAIQYVSLTEVERSKRRATLEMECREDEFLTVRAMVEKGYRKLKNWKDGNASD